MGGCHPQLTGHSQADTISRGAPVSSAWRTAHRRAASEDCDPSTPTTIRRRVVVVPSALVMLSSSHGEVRRSARGGLRAPAVFRPVLYHHTTCTSYFRICYRGRHGQAESSE